MNEKIGSFKPFFLICQHYISKKANSIISLAFNEQCHKENTFE